MKINPLPLGLGNVKYLFRTALLVIGKLKCVWHWQQTLLFLPLEWDKITQKKQGDNQLSLFPCNWGEEQQNGRRGERLYHAIGKQLQLFLSFDHFAKPKWLWLGVAGVSVCLPNLAVFWVPLQSLQSLELLWSCLESSRELNWADQNLNCLLVGTGDHQLKNKSRILTASS